MGGPEEIEGACGPAGQTGRLPMAGGSLVPGGRSGGGRLNLLLSFAGWQAQPWMDAVDSLLEPLGIVAHRAGSGREASEVIRRVPIHIAVVDLGLPLDGPGATEEAGARLLELMFRLAPPPPTVVIKRARGHRDDSREITAALRAGAFAVIDRPRSSQDLNLMFEVLRRCLHRFYSGRWPGEVPPRLPPNVV